MPMRQMGSIFLTRCGLLLALFLLCAVPELVVAQGRSFKGQQLSGRDYTGQHLDTADFSGATLRGAVFRNASLKSTDFRNADLRGADLSGADLTGADLRGAKMPFNAPGAKLAQAKLDGLDVSGAGFDRADFSGAGLQGTRGWGAISGTSFRGADLRAADLAGAYNARVADASLFAGASYDEATRWPKWLDPEAAGARRIASAAPPPAPREDTLPAQPQQGIPGAAPPIAVAALPTPVPPAAVATTAPPAPPRGTGKDLHGQKYTNQKLEHEDFRDANLQGADLGSANLAHATLENADLRHANLESASLSEANLSGADLRGARLKRADFRDAKLVGANLEEQILYLAAFDKLYAEMVEGYRKQGKDVPYAVNSALETAVRAGAGPSRGNGFLTLRSANLRNTVIYGNMQGVDFRGADLRGADLSETENLGEAFLRNAVYDSRTRWNVDPTKLGAVKGEDIGLPLRWFYATWGIEKKRDGEPDAPQTGVLKIVEDGTYDWSVDSDHARSGKWESLDDAGPKKRSLVLHDGELGLEWVAMPDGDKDLLLVASNQGKSLARYCFHGDDAPAAAK